jgi:hypothetical protein
LILALSALGVTQAQEVELLNDESGGDVEITGQSRFEIVDLQGTFSIRLGKPGQLRYMARDVETRRQEIPVALWMEGSTLGLSPLEESAQQRVFVEITVPPEIDVEIDVADSAVVLSGLMSAVDLRGRNVELKASALKDSVQLEIEGGSVRVGASEGELELVGRGLEVELKHIGGMVLLDLEESNVEVESLRAGLDAQLAATTLVTAGVQGRVNAEANGGRLELAGLHGGAELRLSEAPLSLTEVTGAINLETDSDVQFRELKGNLTMRSYGGGLRGQNFTGQLQVSTDGAVVHLESIQGSVTVEGQDLRVRVKELQKDLTVRTALTELFAENVGGAIDIENEFGDVSISGAKGPVKVRSRDGDVRLQGMEGSVDLEADGLEVEVIWSQVGGENESSVTNKRGDVLIGLPLSSRCSLEGEARSGKIESSLPAVRVSDDGHSARGVLGGAAKPLIRVKSGGDLRIVAVEQPKAKGR